LFQKVGDEKNIGSVQYGDKVRIVAVQAAPGVEGKTGQLMPFRYIWLHDINSTSSSAATDYDILVSRPGYDKQDRDIFVFEPVVPGMTGVVSSMELVRIKSVKHGAYLWTNFTNRMDKDSKSYWELRGARVEAATPQDSNVYGAPKVTLFEKFHFTPVVAANLTTDQAKQDLKEVQDEIALTLGGDTARQVMAAAEARDQKALADKEKERQALADQKAAVEAKLAIADKLSAEKVAELQKVQADLAAAQAAREQADKEAAEKMASANLKLDEASKALAEQQMKAKAQEDQAQALAAQLASMQNMPLGFARVMTDVQAMGLGLIDHQGEQVINNSGEKAQVTEFDDLVITVKKDGTVMRDGTGIQLLDKEVTLHDEADTLVKPADVAVGVDGTTYVISADGKRLYSVNWKDNEAARMPQPELGFQVAQQKEAVRVQVKAEKGKAGKKSKKAGKKKAAPVAAAEPVAAVIEQASEALVKAKKVKKAKKTAVKVAAPQDTVEQHEAQAPAKKMLSKKVKKATKKAAAEQSAQAALAE
jgi:hypothetical protein